MNTVSPKTLLLFGVTRLDQMLKKGNVWYVRHYESYFDQVYVVYLLGNPHEPIRRGNTTLLSLGRGNLKLDLLLAPYGLYKIAKALSPTVFLTADLAFAWWTSCLIRKVLGAKVYLMPVCMPEILRANGARFLPQIPLWLEKKFIQYSFASASHIWTGRSCGNYVSWLQNDPNTRDKLVVTDTLAEVLPSCEFFEQLKILQNGRGSEDAGKDSRDKSFRYVYVGRLHHEKLVDDLIRAMAIVSRRDNGSPPISLMLVGDGPARPQLEELARELCVQEHVLFKGVVSNAELPQLLLASNAFVSTLTGTSLREAALCGLPVVAYDIDWINGMLKHEETALLVKPRDIEGLAEAMVNLAASEPLRKKLGQNICELAGKFWDSSNLSQSLERAFSV